MVDVGIEPGIIFEGIPVATFQHLIRSMQISHYGIVLVATAFAYDHLTTLHREVAYVWKGKRSLTKSLFLFNRYNSVIYFGWNLFLQFFPSPSDKFCMVNTSINYIIGTNVMMTGTGVLLLRTWALYNRDRRMLVAFVVIYCVTLTPIIALVVKGYLWGDVAYTYTTAMARTATSMGENTTQIHWISAERITELDSMFMGCYVSGYPRNFTDLYLIALLYESALFFLTIYRLWKLRLSSGLMAMLLRDGTVYYIMILASLLGATVLGRSEGVERAVVASSFFIGCKSVAISHLILRLRDYLAPEPGLDTTEPGRRAETSIQFAPPALSNSAIDSFKNRSLWSRDATGNFRGPKTDTVSFWTPVEEIELGERRGSNRRFSRLSELEAGSSPAATASSYGDQTWLTLREEWSNSKPFEGDDLKDGPDGGCGTADTMS